jgi:hypothetical protein
MDHYDENRSGNDLALTSGDMPKPNSVRSSESISRLRTPNRYPALGTAGVRRKSRQVVPAATTQQVFLKTHRANHLHRNIRIKPDSSPGHSAQSDPVLRMGRSISRSGIQSDSKGKANDARFMVNGRDNEFEDKARC